MHVSKIGLNLRENQENSGTILINDYLVAWLFNSMITQV